jgi:hypothetical protein
MNTSNGGTKCQQFFTDQTADETLGQWMDVRGYQDITFYLTADANTISSGVISIEEAAPKDFSTSSTPEVFGAATDGYSLITTYTATGINGGKQVAIHLQVRSYCFVRARISTAIGGGGKVSANAVAY